MTNYYWDEKIDYLMRTAQSSIVRLGVLQQLFEQDTQRSGSSNYKNQRGAVQ